MNEILGPQRRTISAGQPVVPPVTPQTSDWKWTSQHNHCLQQHKYYAMSEHLVFGSTSISFGQSVPSSTSRSKAGDGQSASISAAGVFPTSMQKSDRANVVFTELGQNSRCPNQHHEDSRVSQNLHFDTFVSSLVRSPSIANSLCKGEASLNAMGSS
jgi:hypothetical protein